MCVKFVNLRRYQKQSKCKVDITFTSHLRANTTRINICVCIIIASNANLGQIWSPKFASYLLQLQIRLNPIFRPVGVSWNKAKTKSIQSCTYSSVMQYIYFQWFLCLNIALVIG